MKKSAKDIISAAASGAVLALLLASAAPSAKAECKDNCFTAIAVRPANSSGTKIMSPYDVVSNRDLSPRPVRNPFRKTTKKDAFPKAFTKEGSLYIVAAQGDTVLVAEGGEGIVYGETVSRNEFGISGGIFFSPDSSKLGFYRKDESSVHLFPLLDINYPGGGLKTIRYPMAGTHDTEHIDFGVYDLQTRKTSYLDFSEDFDNERYITNISWSRDSQELFIHLLSRSQKDMMLNVYDSNSGVKKRTLLTEHNDCWVEPQNPLHHISDTEAIYTTDNRDSYTNLYLLNTQTGQLRRLSCIDKDVNYLAHDSRYIYFTAADMHEVNNQLYKASLKNSKVQQLTTGEGWHGIVMSPDCSRFLDRYERLDMAPRTTICSSKDGKVLETIQESEDPTAEYAYSEIELGYIKSADGKYNNYYRLIKPKDFDPQKKYPLILYVYGGPHSQLVQNRFLASYRRWEMYMAQRGFAVFVMDGRGTQRHGSDYEKAIYGQCGVKETEDQMEAIRLLKTLPWIDSERIGVYGWSYGGFMSLTLATTHPEVFKVCAAGGPVIDWKWYEVMYGERYMSTPENNPEGYAKTSLLNKASSLEAKTLVIQGAVDPTVLPLNALSFIQKCIDCDKQVEYFTYPLGEHNMIGHDREHLVEKVSRHFIENL